MNRLLALAAALLLLASPAPAAEPAPPAGVPLGQIIEALVRDLGAQGYEARERATLALRRIGQPALAALEKAGESDDPEIRVRARQVLADVRLGISPDWPSEIVLLVRHYSRLEEGERYEALQRLTSNLGPKAVPFLVLRLAEGSNREAQFALQHLYRQNNQEVWQQVIRLIPDPKTDAQAKALAWARAQSGQALEALELLARSQIKDAVRDQAIEAGVQDLLAKLKERKHADAAAAAEKFAKAAPADPRFLYLRAEALVALDKDAEAAALRQQALALAPDAEAPHYLAGELLGQLGRRRLAAAEWQRILDIPPADGVYDINAHLRLSALYAASGLFDRAAASLERAFALFTKARDAGDGMALAGGTAESLQMEINRLRQKAAQYPAPPDAVLEDEIGEGALKATVAVLVKDDKLAELQQALASSAAQLTVAVQPPDLKLFDLPAASVRLDKEKKLLGVFLHDTPACKPIPFEPQAKQSTIAVHCADAVYLFKLDAETGQAERTARYEKDYLLTIRPGVKIAAWANVAAKVNGAATPWDKLLEGGVPLDRLPDALDIQVEGTAPSGARSTARLKLPLAEPPLPPAAKTK